MTEQYVLQLYNSHLSTHTHTQIMIDQTHETMNKLHDRFELTLILLEFVLLNMPRFTYKLILF